MSLLRCCVSKAACLRAAGPLVSKLYLSTSPTVLARYTDKHEWADRAAAGPATSTVVRVGISRYAASTLGDVVYVALPEPGETVAPAEPCGAVESVKAASEIFSPVAGVVEERNGAVEDRPGLVNTSPEGEGWLFSVRMTDPGQWDALMSEEHYQKFLDSQEDDLH